MNRKHFTATLGLALALATTSAGAQEPQTDALGGNRGARFAPARAAELPAVSTAGGRDRLLRWHEISMAATALDHTPAPPGDPRVFREQLGPHRSSRALAMVHIAMFDAINAITGNRFRSYSGLPPVIEPANLEAAISAAGFLTTASLWPGQAETFEALFDEDLAEMPETQETLRGLAFGTLAAAAILGRRHNDGAAHAEPVLGEDYFPGDGPGEWRQDPISQIPLALGARWRQVRPFVMFSPAQFRSAPPPALTSTRYAAAYAEVKRLGGDGITTPTARTPQQTIAGIYWAYDGTPNLSAPPRLYNQITMTIAASRGTTDVTDLARLLALVNTAMADAGLACWETKYFYKFWRPVGGIREGDQDDNPATPADPGFSPLGAPASNINPGVNFTPPFPAYPSGHATFGAALFQILRRFYGTDAIAFTFVSDELNGITTDNQGNVRPLVPRSFPSLSAAEEENGQSRIYLGIHWEFDKTAGIVQGRRVADFVWSRAFQRR